MRYSSGASIVLRAPVATVLNESTDAVEANRPVLAHVLRLLLFRRRNHRFHDVMRASGGLCVGDSLEASTELRKIYRCRPAAAAHTR